MKKLFAIILLLILSSCDMFKENGINFKIRNNSEQTITDAKFYTSEKLAIAEFNKIEKNETASDFLSMENNKSDGEYVLEFTRADGHKEIIRGGYYTNGWVLDQMVEFEIKTDTTLIKFSGIK